MSTSAAHRHFHDELAELKAKLLTMSGEAQAALDLAVEAVLKRDAEQAARVIAGDRALDGLELEIEEMVLRLLATQQPMARDLRLLMAATKIANDLERVGDHAVNIAQSTERLVAHRPITPEPELVEMARQARAMLAGALDAFVRGDPKLGREICRRDDSVDALHRSVFRIVLTHMAEDPRMISAGMELFLVSRNLERVADLATNIAEDVVFLVEGKTIKHHAEDVTSPPGAAPGTRGSRTA
ncbi:MAG: phosphate signaling complex protein PhoU [Gemmatimonadales bacterium]